MSDEQLFIIIRAICWYNPILQMPQDEELKKFIDDAKARFSELFGKRRFFMITDTFELYGIKKGDIAEFIMKENDWYFLFNPNWIGSEWGKHKTGNAHCVAIRYSDVIEVNNEDRK